MIEKKNVISSLLYSLIVSMFCAVGYCAKRYHRLVISTISMTVFMIAFIIFFFIGCLVIFIINKNNSRKDKLDIEIINMRIKKSGVYYLISVFAILTIWLPSLLALYPGLYAYDASWQYGMYVDGQVTAHHPIIHTYLLGWLIDTVYRITGSFNKGILAYTLVQELIIAAECGVVFYVFYKRHERLWKHILAFLFLALFPTVVIFVFTSTKDSIFAIATAVFILLNLCLVEDTKSFFEDKAYIVLWILFALQVLILRNNALYAMVLTLPFLIMVIVKSNCSKVRAFIMLGITIGIFAIYRYPITNAVTVAGTSKAEMLSVPCQQIMRVNAYHREELSDSQKEAIDTLFDPDLWYGYYVPEIADATKGSLRMTIYEADSSLFWNLWKELYKEYPQEYIDSFLENTYGFWYPWPHYIIYSFGGEGYTPIVCAGPGELNSKIPWLLDIYKNFENGDIVQHMPWISWLFAPATYMYIALFVGVYMIQKKQYKKCVPILFLALLWCTYLLGPVAMVRYALYLYALVPVWPAYMRK